MSVATSIEFGLEEVLVSVVQHETKLRRKGVQEYTSRFNQSTYSELTDQSTTLSAMTTELTDDKEYIVQWIDANIPEPKRPKYATRY